MKQKARVRASAKTPEGKVKNRIKEVLNELGCYWFMPVAGEYNRSGVPDLIACYKGLFVGIEAKSNKTTHPVTVLQKKNLDEISKSNGLALVIDETNVDKLSVLIEEFFNKRGTK